MNWLTLHFASELEHRYREARFPLDVGTVRIIVSGSLATSILAFGLTWIDFAGYLPLDYVIYGGTIVTFAVCTWLAYRQTTYHKIDRRTAIVACILAGTTYYQIYTSILAQVFIIPALAYYFFVLLGLIAIPAAYVVRAGAIIGVTASFIAGFALALSVFDVQATGVVILASTAAVMSAIASRALEVTRRRAFLAQEENAIQRLRVEALLHSIVPPSVAAALNDRTDFKHSIVQRYESATVLFADLVGFTSLAASVSPERLVQLLNGLFSRFDVAAEQCGVEKVKTIGDAYMAVAGAPEATADHVQRMADFAFEIREAVRKFSLMNDIDLRVRIGMHCGPLVAGVIGTTRFHYDLWGEAVNGATRLESHGVAGSIQVSEAVRLALGDHYLFDDRGMVDVKGAGKMRLFILRQPSAKGTAVTKRPIPAQATTAQREFASSDVAAKSRGHRLTLAFPGDIEAQYRDSRKVADQKTFFSALSTGFALAIAILAGTVWFADVEKIGLSIFLTRIFFVVGLGMALVSAFLPLSVKTRDLHLNVGTTAFSIATAMLAFGTSPHQRAVVVAGFFVVLTGFHVLPIVFGIRLRAVVLLVLAFIFGFLTNAPATEMFGWLTIFFVVGGAVLSLLTSRAQELAHRGTYQAVKETTLQRHRADRLLRSIVPGSIADRLEKRIDPRLAIVDHFDDATVLFAYLVGFENLAKNTTPETLVALLNTLVSRFDEAALQRGVEKIKTTGASYMATCGVPVEASDHVQRMAAFALDMLAIVKAFAGEHALELQVRIGMHCGPVVAGVIGTTRFHYDLWGETVNVAARLESHGVDGAIQISSAIKEALGQQYDFIDRGMVALKGLQPVRLALLVSSKASDEIKPIRWQDRDCA